MEILQVESLVGAVVFYALLAVKIFAFGSAMLYSAESYEAAGKLTKTTWCVILGFGVLLTFVPVGGMILTLVATIAALVYLADVRPALANLTRR